MTERPILFNGPMVRAILDGRKTQTRRVVKPQPKGTPELGGFGRLWFDGRDDMQCPYGVRGDRLWVREAWKSNSTFNDQPPRDIPPGCRVFYLADPSYSPDAARYRHARFMPRWASRITLEVTGVRVERLQEISEEDADAEGFGGDFPHAVMPELFPDADEAGQLSIPQCYRILWESINGEGSWEANPWVWAITFRRLDLPNEAGDGEGGGDGSG